MEESITLTFAIVLIGSGAVATGVVGLRLPTGDRISAGLALLAGAGAGVMALAIGAYLVDDRPETIETVFLIASALGFATTLAGLALLWRWTGRRRKVEHPGAAGPP